MNEKKKEVFLQELKCTISRMESIESHDENSVGCKDLFNGEEMYDEEEKLFLQVTSSHKNTTEQGDALENLLKKLFNRIQFLDCVAVTNKDIAIGQIDLQLNVISDRAYKFLGLIDESPLGLMGECKNYGFNKKVPKDDIEKICWRCCKSGFLSFFIGANFTSGALNEIDTFNLNKRDFCVKNHGVYIVPIDLEMLQVVIENKINFCYFVKWLVNRAYSNSQITSHLRSS